MPVNNLRTYAPDYGTITQVYNGLDINVNARMRNGLQVQAGTSTGQRVTDYCDVRGQICRSRPADSRRRSEVHAYSPVNPFCHVAPGITTRFTGAGTYTDPEDRRAAQRHVPEQPGRAAAGELDGVERDRRAVARPAARRAPRRT